MLPRFEITRSFAVTAVLGAVLALAGPARAGLGVGPSAPFDPTKIRAVRTQERVAAAGDGATTLFAWVDHRSGNADVYAARVQADGTVLDPNGIAVAVTGQDEGEPTVSWNGTQWLVAWTKGTSLVASRVAANGEVLDPSGIEIATNPFQLDSPSAAGLGTEHLVVWRESDTSPRLVGALLDGAGNIVTTTPLTTGLAEVSPSIAVRGSVALCTFVSTSSPSQIHGFRFQRSTSGPVTLVRLNATDVVVSPGGVRPGSPTVATGPNGWLVAWVDSRNGGGSGTDIFAARIAAGGTLLDTNGIAVATETGNDIEPAAIHTGSEWLVTWSQDGVGQFLRSVANNGNAAAQRRDVSTEAGTLGLGALGGAPATPILAWSDPEPGSAGPKPLQDLLGRVVAANLSLGAAFPIATQTPNQTQPAMAFGANRWLIAWVDDRFGPTEGMIRFAVTDSGRIDAPSPEEILPVALRPGHDQAQPAACYDGTNFNVFWSEQQGDHRAIVGARFTAGGAFIDTFTVADGAWDHVEPACALHADGVVDLVWTDHRLPLDANLWGRRMLDGAPAGDEFVVANQPGDESRPRLARRVIDTVENSSFVVYQLTNGPDSGSIFGRFIYEAPLTTSFEQTIRSEAGHVFESPQIAWNGEMWLVTYQELIENDGPSLYIPWATWIGHPYDFVSFALQIGPGSYVPANPIVGSAAANFVTLRSRQYGPQVDLDIRRAEASPGFVDNAPIPYTSDAYVDVPGAASQGQGDRVGLLHLRRQDDSEWQGLRLFGADVQDTLAGRVVINEFLANPPSDAREFYELYNVSGQTFQMLGWTLVVDGESTDVDACFSGAPGPAPGAAKTGGNVVNGSFCGELPNQTYFGQTDFFGLPESPTEGHLPNRGALLQLISPGGVMVDEVGYGFRGGAPVIPALPIADVPAARIGPTGQLTQSAGDVAAIVNAAGDSVAVSTARLPDGTDTGSDANDFNSTNSTTPGAPNTGNASALNTSLITTRLFWNPPTGSVDAIELFNPYDQDIDFTNWYVGTNDGTQRIGVPGNAWSVLRRLDKRVLRRGEAGSFSTDLDYLTVVYLFKPDFTRVEQIGWSRADNAQPQMCMKRDPDTGGLHSGFDWLSSGGEQELFVGQLHYEACPISGPDATVGGGEAPATLAFRGAIPNPTGPAGGNLVFTVPGVSGGAGARVRLRLIDVAGRVRATLVDGPMSPGEHRVGLAGRSPGIYYAELDIDGHRLARPVVIVP